MFIVHQLLIGKILITLYNLTKNRNCSCNDLIVQFVLMFKQFIL